MASASHTVIVKLVFFAATRELSGCCEKSLLLTTPTTAKKLFREVSSSLPKLQILENSVVVAVNQEYIEGDTEEVNLSAGDEVAFIPPISGELITDPKCGAISLFVGTTRDLFDGKEVVSLEYEAYEGMAKKEMFKLAQEARQQWPLEKVAIIHRLGRVGVAEASIVVGVSSVHRAEAMAATTFIMDTIKARVPVWKREVYSDGSTSWKENKECSWRTNQ